MYDVLQCSNICFRPILVLPPAHIEVVECEQSEQERDFYEALFRRSKVYLCLNFVST